MQRTIPLQCSPDQPPLGSYQTFPVWTEESLQELRERKSKAEEKAVEAMERLKDETRMMGETSNPLLKAMHFRNGASADIFLEIPYNSFQNLISTITAPIP